jgi:hypothetical protein
VKLHIIATVFFCVLCVSALCADDESISRNQLNFLEHQGQPFFVADVMKRLSAIDGRSGCFCYSYKVRGERITIEFWVTLPPPDPPPPQGRPVEISMVVESRDGARAKIIWPQSLRGTDIETAKRKFYPHGW